jgi:cardiolipin synthase
MSRASSIPRGGHHLQLLQGSVEFFPALIAAVDSALREVRLETYIFDLTGQSTLVAYALERAARRGVEVKVVVDGFGSAPLPPAWQERFADAGVQWRVYAPLGWFSIFSLGSWRRLHRKLCVVDGEVAFCGGINILDDFHDPNHGALESPRLDFALRATGPLVGQMHEAMQALWLRIEAMRELRHAHLSGALVSLRASGQRAAAPAPHPPSHGLPQAKAALLLRDNVRNRTRIEHAYLRAIGRARVDIIIANAYFVPGRKMRHALVRAARRGVQVSLLLQGRYEYFMQFYAARPVFGALLEAGVRIYEYSPSFLHAKVAVVDGHWATVGSSNLDPLSLLLAREANVVVEDTAFAARLRTRLLHAMQHEGQPMDPTQYEHRSRATRAKEWLALGLMRIALAIQGKTYL